MTELIVRNLVANAIKFTPECGTINLSSQQENNITTFKVSNSGIGMPIELLSQLNGIESTYITKPADREPTKKLVLV